MPFGTRYTHLTCFSVTLKEVPFIVTSAWSETWKCDFSCTIGIILNVSP